MANVYTPDCVIRSVCVAVKMPLPPGRTRRFEATEKQDCVCVAWSRKRRAGFISRQGIMKAHRSAE